MKSCEVANVTVILVSPSGIVTQAVGGFNNVETPREGECLSVVFCAELSALIFETPLYQQRTDSFDGSNDIRMLIHQIGELKKSSKYGTIKFSLRGRTLLRSFPR
jgi:hypothetical protein